MEKFDGAPPRSQKTCRIFVGKIGVRVKSTIIFGFLLGCIIYILLKKP
jgi:hypothetical protein